MPFHNKAIGIIGGMGPMATADLFRKIVELEDSEKDQEHVRILVDCNSNIPDRSSAIVANGESPLPEMVRSAVGLERSGADVLIMGCNTAHHFYPDILPFVNVPFLSMLDETCKAIIASGYKRVGMLACSATINSGVYARALNKFNIDFMTVNAEEQKEFDRVIFDGVKAGETAMDTTKLQESLQRLVDNGVEAFVLGCTELPVAFHDYKIPSPVPLLDPTSEIAKSALRLLNRRVRGETSC